MSKTARTVPFRLAAAFASAAAAIIPLLAGCAGPDTSVTPTPAPSVATVTVTPATTTYTASDQLAGNICFVCHQTQTPGITSQFVQSVMAQNGVTCSDCHQTASDYPGTQAHYGVYRLAAPTPGMCQDCHADEVSQFEQSRHSIPSYVAVNGTEGLSASVMAMYQAIPEGSYLPDKSEHPLAALEGEPVTPYACHACHSIGQPHADGSAGQCQQCHLTHTFSIEQARKPETCNACHIGPDPPQWEIYQESAHGIRYATDGDNWNWDAPAGSLSIDDMPAPTCATCHISAFGGVPGTHDTGERLTTFLFAEISSTRPNADNNALNMQAVCRQCHSQDFVARLYDGGGALTESVNGWMTQADEIMAHLKARGLLT
jgi:hypothetical protein